MKKQHETKEFRTPAIEVHWNQVKKRFRTVSPLQANRHAQDPLRYVEPHQVMLLEKVIFPTIERMLNARGSEDPVFIHYRDFDLPETHNGIDPVITPAMLEVVRRRYAVDAAGNEAVGLVFRQDEERMWTVIVHPLHSRHKTCCLEFR